MPRHSLVKLNLCYITTELLAMEELETLRIEFEPIIKSIINDNAKFYQFTQEVKWQYIYNEDYALVAKCDSNLTININIAAISHMRKVNQPLMLEYFILHEIRHLYQHLFILQYHLKPADSNYKKAVQWLTEFNHYTNVYEDRNRYYYQSIEFDAFAFSYAVMLYKYGKVDYISAPNIYDNDPIFYSVVSQFISYFKNNSF